MQDAEPENKKGGAGPIRSVCPILFQRIANLLRWRLVNNGRPLQLVLRDLQIRLERLLLLALEPEQHRFQHIVRRVLGREFRLRTFLEDAGAHEDGIPRVFGLLVELIGAADVGFRGVAHEVHGLRRGVNAVCVFAPLLQEAGGELEGADLGFAEGGRLEFFARHGFEHGFQGQPEGAHADARQVVRRRPDDVVV